MDCNSATADNNMEDVSLSRMEANKMIHSKIVPTMGGTAIANPMDPTFPLSNSGNVSTPIPHHEVEVSYGSKSNYAPESYLKTSHSFPGQNNFDNSDSMSPVASPQSENGGSFIRPSNSKIDTLKSWSITTYKCTKQMISEKLGKSTKTVDVELDNQIENLKDTQRKYSQILRLARVLSSHFYHVVQTQSQLGDAFSDLSQKSPELQEEFIYNAETQRTLTKNGETLLGALHFFINSVNTLCNKTMEDTLYTIKQYEQARIEYDAYRTDLEQLSQQPRIEVSSIKLDAAQRQFEIQREVYEQLKLDVGVKLKFLNENKVKVMHKQLLLFHNAVSAYFSGNQAGLEATLKQFNVKLNTPNTASPSWLEQ